MLFPTRPRTWAALALVMIAGAAAPSRADAQVKLYVAQSQGTYTSNGYGGAAWTGMTSLLNTTFGAANVTAFSDLSNLGTLMSYDRLWLDQRLGPTLTATELSNVATFLATGRRAVLIGENDSWAAWNAQITGLVGGSSIDQCQWSAFSTVYSHPLTAGVNSVTNVCGSVAVGGTALFASNFATLWGSALSTLTILDSNLQDDQYWTQTDNQQFAANTATWLAGSSVVATPEPASVLLLGSGLVALGLVSRRRRFA